jgi:hypothetical protein
MRMRTELAPELATEHIADLPKFLARFARDPVGQIKEPSRLTWPAAFTLQIVAAIVSGALTAIVEKSALDLVISIFVFPIIMVMIGAVFTLFIYYYFAVFTRTYLDIRRLYSLVVIAMFPYFVIHALSGFLPPLDLIGFALTGILLIVGLVEQFRLGRKPVAQLVGLACVIFFVVWSAVQYMTA